MSVELAERVNALPGWVKEMGIVILTASADEVTCEWKQLVAQGRVRLLCVDNDRALG